RTADHERQRREIRLLLLDSPEFLDRENTAQHCSGALQIDVAVHRVDVSDVDQLGNERERIGTLGGLCRHDEFLRVPVEPAKLGCASAAFEMPWRCSVLSAGNRELAIKMLALQMGAVAQRRR